MRKPKNTKKEKVPRLTEAQYAAYINGLKGEEDGLTRETGQEKEPALQRIEKG